MNQKLKIKISPVGNVSVDAIGFTGTSCKDATEAFENALAGASSEITTTDKPEMYQDGENLQEESW